MHIHTYMHSIQPENILIQQHDAHQAASMGSYRLLISDLGQVCVCVYVCVCVCVSVCLCWE